LTTVQTILNTLCIWLNYISTGNQIVIFVPLSSE